MTGKAKQVATGPIPVPPNPPNDDVPDKSTYINKALSADQKRQLLNSANQFADILEWGSWTSQYEEAAKNVSHYRHARGATRNLTDTDVQSMEREIPGFKSNQNKYLTAFINDIVAQFKSNKLKVACFLYQEGPSDYWIGYYARGNKWYYAMGGFLYSFGARAETVISTGK